MRCSSRLSRRRLLRGQRLSLELPFEAEFLIGALPPRCRRTALFRRRTVKDRVAGRFMVVLSQPLKICSFAPSTPLRQASLALARKERKRGKNEVSRYTINTACLTPPFDDPFLGQNRDSVFNVGFIDLLQYEQHEALYKR